MMSETSPHLIVDPLKSKRITRQNYLLTRRQFNNIEKCRMILIVNALSPLLREYKIITCKHKVTLRYCKYMIAIYTLSVTLER